MTHDQSAKIHQIAELSENLRGEIQTLYAGAEDPVLREWAYTHLRTIGTLNADLVRMAKSLPRPADMEAGSGIDEDETPGPGR